MRLLGSLILTVAMLAAAIFTAAAGAQEASMAKKPEIIAHRGASAYAPENTLAAYRLAWEQGSPSAEVDVWLTKDNKVICLHDKTTKRVTGVDLLPREANFAEIAVLDAGGWKNPVYTGERIPLLSDLIAAMPADRHLFLEIKDNEDIVPFVKEIIEKSGKKHQITIIGFSYDVMKAFREAMPDMPIKWLIGSEKDKTTGEYQKISPANVQKAKEAGFDGLNVSYLGVTQELIDASKAAGFELYIWTVDDPKIARKMVEMGVAGVTTNVPDVMLKEFGIK